MAKYRKSRGGLVSEPIEAEWRSKVFISRREQYLMCDNAKELLLHFAVSIGASPKTVKEYKDLEDKVNDLADILEERMPIFIGEPHA